MFTRTRKGRWRSAATLGRKLVTPKKIWHMLEVWPELRLERQAEAGQWRGWYQGQFIGVSSDMNAWKNIWQDDKPCFLVGTGPSMRQQNLHRLSDGRSILLNGALSLIETHGIRPAAVVIVDYRFVRDRGQWLALIPPGTPCFFTPAVLRAVCQRSMSFLACRPWHVLDNALRPYGHPRRSWQNLGSEFVLDDPHNPQAAFSLDLVSGFVDARTVMYAACQLAVYAGAQNINLVGFDIANARQPRFNETVRNRLGSRLDKAYDGRILPAMRLFSRICRKRGIRCWNHSPVSCLPAEVIPRSHWLNKK